MAGTDSTAEGDCKPTDPLGTAWLRAVSGDAGGQGANAGAECVRGTGKGGGGPRSGGTLSGIARGAGSTGTSGANAGAGDADYRGHGSGPATQSERSGIGEGIGNARIKPVTGATAECESDDRGPFPGVCTRGGNGGFAR